LAAPAGDTTDGSLGELFGRLVGEGREVARSEASFYKALASYRLGKAKGGLIALGAGIVFAHMGAIALTIGLVLAVATLIGPLGAGLAVAAALGLVGFLLVRYGAARLTVLSGDAEERAAISAGERSA
jgi:hypothetical protein